MKINRSDFLKTILISLTSVVLNSCRRMLSPTPQTTKPTSTNTPEYTATNTPQPTATSQPRSTPTPLCLQLTEPKDGAELPAIGKFRFEWDAYPSAMEYRFELTLPNGTTIILGDTPNTYRDQYLEMLGGGEYQWQVLALDIDENIICISEPFIFTKPTTPKSPGGTQNNGSDPAIPPPPPPPTEGNEN